MNDIDIINSRRHSHAMVFSFQGAKGNNTLQDSIIGIRASFYWYHQHLAIDPWPFWIVLMLVGILTRLFSSTF